MSIQGINGTAAQQYQSTQQTAQGNSQTSQGESGPKVRKGGGHHHHSKPQPTGSTQATTATSATSPATQTATAVTGVATTAPATESLLGLVNLTEPLSAVRSVKKGSGMLLFTVASSTGSKEVVIDPSNKTLGALLLKDWQGRTTSEIHFKNFETITIDGQTALVPKEIEMMLYKRNADGSSGEQQLVIAYYERVFNQTSRSFRFSTPKKAKMVNLNDASALPWM